MSTLVYPTDIMEYEYTNHMWVICSMYMCSIYPMYINVNYFVFPFVYLKDIMEYEYTKSYVDPYVPCT